MYEVTTSKVEAKKTTCRNMKIGQLARITDAEMRDVHGHLVLMVWERRLVDLVDPEHTWTECANSHIEVEILQPGESVTLTVN